MKKIIFVIFISLFLSVALNAQTATANSEASKTTTTKKPKFRATKAQILQVQKMLKVTETGKMDVEFKTAIKAYQKDNGLKQKGSLNRATLEKMNVELTDTQKLIPISPDSYATAETDSAAKPKKTIFRANKEQVMEAQKKLKTGAMYAGEETGKLDDATREGIKKFQTANGVKVTGTLNKETLEKMGIALTDKQKAM
jgi:peptidoglycan hydrolase-like protein with peptidoglycan-binding domain